MTSFLGLKIFACIALVLMACFSERAHHLFEEGKFNHSILLYIHVISVGSWTGIQGWVVFVAGIVMYFNLPRHVFGEIQSKLWPLFFGIGGALSTLALLTNGAVMKLRSEKTTSEELMHVSGLIVSLACSLLNFVVLEPQATHYWYQRFLYEKERGFGNEIGPLTNREELNTPKYKQLTHNFAKVHGISSLSTVSSYIGSLVYLWYLTSHLIST
ncbi:transmembrane protein 205 [Nematostella vectensis]|uniref:transmembrane protein 205 n=1 Tax=Nematostella vectensis TaxID=45351 RepID=UPI00139027C0|nr:transmembrane protein 205 [Nematostella vectensis]